MNVLRLAQERDIQEVYELAKSAPPGLTTLPADREKITAKVMESVKNQNFPPSAPNGESFLFVLERNGKLIGTSAIFTKVGGFQPFWTYAVEKELNQSDLVGIRHEVRYLKLKKQHSGPSEIGTLYLQQEHRCKHAGRQLSLSRFLFMAQHRSMFEDTVLAELRGTVSPDGQAAFWDAVGAHFFGIPYTKADLLVTEDKSFIDELMPKFPIYIDLLPREAQEVIGVVAKETRPALTLLEQEGFNKIDEVDIFEAGPIVSCSTDKIRTIQQSKTSTFANTVEFKNKEKRRLYLVCNEGTQNQENIATPLSDFRSVVTPITISDGGIYLPQEAADALEMIPGDPLRYVPLRPNSQPTSRESTSQRNTNRKNYHEPKQHLPKLVEPL